MLINWRECSDIKQEDIDRIKDDIGEDAFLQEYENQFLSDAENQEFPMALIIGCINHEIEYQELDSQKEYIAGADIGRTKDLTAFTVFEKDDNKFKLVYKKIMKNTPYNEQMDFFKYMLKNYKFLKFRIDESGIGNMLAEEIQRNYFGITPITFNNENKQEMVSNLKRLMQAKKLEYPEDQQLINSMRAIRRIFTASNYLRFDSVRDGEIGHSDLFWSMALALYGESIQEQLIMPIGIKYV
jgi:phage FluMu gp28-like protein